MKTLFLAIVGVTALAGSVQAQADVSVQVGLPSACVAYVGPVGFYNSDCGYWGGPVVGWDHNYFARGHEGYGHGSWHRDDKAHKAHWYNRSKR